MTTTTTAAAMPATCNEATTADEVTAHPLQHLLRNGPVMLKLRACLRVSPGAWAFFRQILDHLHTHGEAWPSLPTLMRETGYTSPTSATRFVHELAQKAGVLRARLVRQVGGWPLYHYSLGPTLVAWLEALDQGTWHRPDGPTVARAAPRLEPPPTIEVGPAEPPPMVAPEPPPTTVTKSQISDLRDLRSRSPLPPEPLEAEGPSRGAEPLISILEEPRQAPAANVEERRNVIADRLRGEVTDVLSHWRAMLVPGNQGKLETNDRVTLIRELLYGDADDGGCFTAQELKWAIDAAKKSPWWSDDRHLWRRRITVLFKSTDRIGELATRGRELASESARKSAAAAAKALEDAASQERDADRSRCPTGTRTSERISPEQMIEDLKHRGLWLARRAHTDAHRGGVTVEKRERAAQTPLSARASAKGTPPLAGLSSGPPRVDSKHEASVERAAVLAAVAEFRAMPSAANGRAA